MTRKELPSACLVDVITFIENHKAAAGTGRRAKRAKKRPS